MNANIIIAVLIAICEGILFAIERFRSCSEKALRQKWELPFIRQFPIRLFAFIFYYRMNYIGKERCDTSYALAIDPRALVYDESDLL